MEFSALPDDVIRLIVLMFTPKTFVKFHITCKRFYKLCNDQKILKHIQKELEADESTYSTACYVYKLWPTKSYYFKFTCNNCGGFIKRGFICNPTFICESACIKCEKPKCFKTSNMHLCINSLKQESVCGACVKTCDSCNANVCKVYKVIPCGHFVCETCNSKPCQLCVHLSKMELITNALHSADVTTLKKVISVLRI
jgi:hypothetical protein